MTSHYLEKIPHCFTPSAIPNAVPMDGEAVIILAAITDIAPVELPIEELHRADSITHQESRSRYLAGRYLLRGVLSPWLGIRPRDLPIAITDTGKPFLSKGRNIHFSITHTAHAIALIYSPQAVGIDLEQERSLDLSGLARRFFSAGEADYLEQSGSLHDFFRLWSCREAAIKADGRGLATLLASTRVQADILGNGGQIRVGIEGVFWSAIPWILAGGIHGAAAFREVPGVIRWCDLR